MTFGSQKPLRKQEKIVNLQPVIIQTNCETQVYDIFGVERIIHVCALAGQQDFQAKIALCRSGEACSVLNGNS